MVQNHVAEEDSLKARRITITRDAAPTPTLVEVCPTLGNHAGQTPDGRSQDARSPGDYRSQDE